MKTAAKHDTWDKMIYFMAGTLYTHRDYDLKNINGKSLGSGYVRQAADKQLTQRHSPTTDSHGNSWLLGYPPWPSLLLIMQPDHHQLPDEGHVDASLSADALSM